MGMSSHQSPKVTTTSWLTPPEIIRALGHFDLDPCCPPNMPWKTADRMVSLPEDGLLLPEWNGRIWLNPPFGNEAAKWLERMTNCHNGIALLPARTETKLFKDFVWSLGTGIMFLYGRPHFHYPDGTRAKFNSGVPICLVAYGEKNAQDLKGSGLNGRFLWLS